MSTKVINSLYDLFINRIYNLLWFRFSSLLLLFTQFTPHADAHRKSSRKFTSLFWENIRKFVFSLYPSDHTIRHSCDLPAIKTETITQQQQKITEKIHFGATDCNCRFVLLCQLKSPATRSHRFRFNHYFEAHLMATTCTALDRIHATNRDNLFTIIVALPLR